MIFAVGRRVIFDQARPTLVALQGCCSMLLIRSKWFLWPPFSLLSISRRVFRHQPTTQPTTSQSVFSSSKLLFCLFTNHHSTDCLLCLLITTIALFHLSSTSILHVCVRLCVCLLIDRLHYIKESAHVTFSLLCIVRLHIWTFGWPFGDRSGLESICTFFIWRLVILRTFLGLYCYASVCVCECVCPSAVHLFAGFQDRKRCPSFFAHRNLKSCVHQTFGRCLLIQSFPFLFEFLLPPPPSHPLPCLFLTPRSIFMTKNGPHTLVFRRRLP